MLSKILPVSQYYSFFLISFQQFSGEAACPLVLFLSILQPFNRGSSFFCKVLPNTFNCPINFFFNFSHNQHRLTHSALFYCLACDENQDKLDLLLGKLVFFRASNLPPGSVGLQQVENQTWHFVCGHADPVLNLGLHPPHNYCTSFVPKAAFFPFFRPILQCSGYSLFRQTLNFIPAHNDFHRFTSLFLCDPSLFFL